MEFPHGVIEKVGKISIIYGSEAAGFRKKATEGQMKQGLSELWGPDRQVVVYVCGQGACGIF